MTGAQPQQTQPQPPPLSALLSPGALAFGTLQLGYTSSTQTATLVNSGSGAINITAINISGDFAQTNNCPTSLAIGAGCLFNIAFTPTATGTRTGSLSITTSASTTAQTVGLSGTGITISTQISLGNLTFNNQAPGTTSGGQTVTLTNTSSVPITVAISTTGSFAETDNCGGGVNVGGSCTITVTFTPTAPGTSNGTLTVTISSNGVAGAPQTVALTGTGTAAEVGFSASTLNFTNQAINASSASQTETVTNTGSANLSITAVAIGGTNAGDFTKGADTCTGAIVAPNKNCTVKVTFTPSAPGGRNASLDFTDNAPASPQAVTLLGTGTEPLVGFSTPGLDFNDQSIDSTSAAQTETVTNKGAANLTITSVGIAGADPGDFSKGADSCTGATIAPSHTCTVKMTFTPSATGGRGAELRFTDNAPFSPQVVGLSGTGTEPKVNFSTSPVTFTSQPINTTSPAQTETVTNNGTGNLHITSVAMGGTNASDFTKGADTCTGATVTPGNTCTVKVTFTPSATGSRSASMNFTDNAPGSPQAVPLSGTGTGPVADLAAPSLTFASQLLSTTSAALTETLTNTGMANLSITSVAISGTDAGDFAKSSDTCSGATLTFSGASSTCKVSVKFTPSAAGSRSATMKFTDDAPGSPQTVPLSGTGTVPQVSFSTPGLSFANQLISTTSAALTETLTNTGTANLSITSVAISGSNAADFAKSADTCTGATLTFSGASSTCKVSVKFTPAAVGSRSASLKFTDNAPASPQSVPLSGTGTAPKVGFSAPSLSFTNQLIKTTSAALTETVTNTGTANLSISTVAIGGTDPSDFSKSADTCSGATLPGNGTCKVSVTFTPPSTGNFGATLNFTDNAGGSPQKVSLSGSGTMGVVGFSAPGLTFVNQPASTTSAPQTETVTNTGTVNATISAVTIGGPIASNFSKSADSCTGATLTPSGASSTCTVSVTFTPSVIGSINASLNFTDSATGSPQSVTLSGTGAGPLASLSATALVFNNQATHTTSAPQTETLTNTGSGNLIISTVAISGTNSGDFSKSTDNCTGATLTPSGVSSTCTVSVTFTPSATGGRSAALNFTDNAGTSPQGVSLEGNGDGPLAGVFTQRYDNSRSGQNTQEVTLTTSNVTESQFGKLFSLPVDGQVYAQPLYMQNVSIPSQGVHNAVYVATENDSVYAFDADGGSTTPLWQVSFLNAGAGVTTVPSADVETGDVSPIIGITSTPVIDPISGTIYVTAKTREPLGSSPSCTSNGSYDYCYRLHALDITTGAEKFGGPVIISASVAGTGEGNVNSVITFSALRHMQRAGILLLNGTLYLGFGSHGDTPIYHGWLMAYDATTLEQKAVFCVTPNSHQGAIWQGGGGIAADSSSPPNLFVVTANGGYDANTTGGIDYSDSVLRMQLISNQLLVLDYFTPIDQATLAGNDLDLGSSPPLLLPDQTGAYPHLLAVGGKDGRLWMLNRDILGGYHSNDTGALQVIPEVGSDSLFAGGSYWNGYVYFQEVGGFLNQFTVEDNGTLADPPTSSAYEGAFPNAPPVVSSNGTTNGVLWLVDATAYMGGGPAVLHALNASDVSMDEIYNSAQAPSNRDTLGPAVKFVVPTVANGKVYVGTATEVDVYGPLAP